MSEKYNFLSRLLHHIALGNNFVPETAFELEKSFHRIAKQKSDETHVFVCGLARAGTTVLMRSLHETNVFASLTYADMPFLLAPNLWRRITSNFSRDVAVQERAHADGVLVNTNSPEALEEVFWRVKAGSDYIRDDRLIPTSIVSEEVVLDFREYVSLILARYDKERYLSKNNNNILRIPVLNKVFPNAVVLIPFREPIQQAHSLLNQHTKFISEDANDAFIRKYMKWLVHHEFGPGQRPFVFGDHDRVFYANTSINYWLEQWIHVYGTLLNMLRKHEINAVPFSYERFCQEPLASWSKLDDILGLNGMNLTYDIQLREADTPPDASPDLLSQASEIYAGLEGMSQL